MAEFPINWQLQRSRYVDNRNRYTSDLKINGDWSLICSWSSRSSQYVDCYRTSYIPELLEIRRNSKAVDILISGNLKLMNSQICLFQWKFIELIEAGCGTTLLELNIGNNYSERSFSITGTLSIPAKGVRKECTKEHSFDSLLELSREFECLLDPKATYFSDMSLKCGTFLFPVHKNILSVRSPVFAAKFSNKMKENQEKKVNIIDISPNILKTMLYYIYTGKTGVLSIETAGELLFAADKYELKDLKRVCCDYLKSCVSVENVLNILVIGDFHDECLKFFAMDFLCNSSDGFEILEKTAEWKNLREQKPSLAMDVLTGLVKSKRQKVE